jgi:hypothetical protein
MWMHKLVRMTIECKISYKYTKDLDRYTRTYRQCMFKNIVKGSPKIMVSRNSTNVNLEPSQYGGAEQGQMEVCGECRMFLKVPQDLYRVV